MPTQTENTGNYNRAINFMYDRNGGFARADIPRAEVYALLAIADQLAAINAALGGHRAG